MLSSSSHASNARWKSKGDPAAVVSLLHVRDPFMVLMPCDGFRPLAKLIQGCLNDSNVHNVHSRIMSLVTSARDSMLCLA